MSNTFSGPCCPIPRHYIDGQHLLRGWSLPFNMSRLDDGNKSGQEHSDTPRFWSMLSVTLSTAFSFSSRVKETNQIYLQIKHVKNEKSFKLLIGSVRIISIRIIIICIESCLGVYVFKQTFETLICPTILSLVGKTRRRCRPHRAGRHFRKKLMSRYIGSSPHGRFDVRIEELVSKAENPGLFLRKNVF